MTGPDKKLVDQVQVGVQVVGSQIAKHGAVAQN